MPIPSDALEKLPESQVDCLRCDARMRQAGPIQLTEGKPNLLVSLFTQLGELTFKTIHFEVLVCPRCGKVELFA